MPHRSLPALLVATLVALSTAPVATVAQDATFSTTEVADGVFRFQWQAHVGMFVVGDRGVVAFDPINPRAAADFASEIRAHADGRPLLFIVYSHSDADHSSGAQVMSDAFGGGVPVVAATAAVDDIVERGSADQTVPHVTFERRMHLDLGNRTIELHFFGPSHSDNNLVAFVPDSGVAFAVDFVANDRVGYQALPGWHFPEQNRTIRRMLDLPIETVVYGHGPVGDRASLRRQADYYDTLEEQVRAAVERGLSEDETVAAVEMDAFSHFDRFGDWFELNVRGAYRIISGGL